MRHSTTKKKKTEGLFFYSTRVRSVLKTLRHLKARKAKTEVLPGSVRSGGVMTSLHTYNGRDSMPTSRNTNWRLIRGK